MKTKRLKRTASLLFTLTLAVGTVPVSANVASATGDSPSPQQLTAINRVFDQQENGVIHYHYEDEDGQEVKLNTYASSADNNTRYSKKASQIPSSYDLRETNAVTPIKDQGLTGACWAFAAIKSMESNQIVEGQKKAENIDLSESHLAWYTYRPSSTAYDPLYGEGITIPQSGSDVAYQQGGSSLLATFTLARWSGAANESTAPFNGLTAKGIMNMVTTMTKTGESLRYQADYKLSDSVCYDNAPLSEIKSVLMDKGAISVAFYYDSGFDQKTPDGEIAYCQNAITDKDTAIDEANHCVTIIGWDDNYPKENFSATPASDGAWLVANSYGEDFGNGGYFWLSYEEPSLTEYYGFRAVSGKTYDNNYQYDGFGWNTAITSSDSSTIRVANIFTANAGYHQKLKAVSLYTVTDNQPYTIKIYQNVTAGKPTSGKLAVTISGKQDYQGYHTVSLPDAVSLKAGERFSVVIAYKQTTNKNGYVPLEGPSYTDRSANFSYNSHPGESYIYLSGNSGKKQWYDINLYGGRDFLSNNVCIKAFTTNTSPVGTISFPQKKVILGRGETYKPNPKIAKISDKTLIWKSSDKKIASVNQNGKITGKKEGKATITATLISGIKASFTIQVKKAPVKITIKPSKKKTIRQKKSFQIKIKLPSGSASNTIKYTSSKSYIAKVSSSGKVIGKKPGKATITVSTYNGKKTIITVTVR